MTDYGGENGLGEGDEVTAEAKEAAKVPPEKVEGAEDLPDDVPSQPIEDDETPT